MNIRSADRTLVCNQESQLGEVRR